MRILDGIILGVAGLSTTIFSSIIISTATNIEGFSGLNGLGYIIAFSGGWTIVTGLHVLFNKGLK